MNPFKLLKTKIKNMLDSKQLSLGEKPAKTFSKTQSLILSTIAGFGMVAGIYVVAFGPNTLASSDMTTLIRQEKQDYIQTRITSEQRDIIESQLTIEALEKVNAMAATVSDPSSLDIDAEVNNLLGF